MIDGVDFDAQPAFEPTLQLRFVRIDLVGEDGEWRAAINRFQASQDRLDEGLIGFDPAHVIDGKHGCGFQ